MADLRFPLGLVGLANQGQEHLHAARLSERARFVAVCDTDTALLQAVRAEHPELRAYTRIDELLADDEVRGLVLALPHHAYEDHWSKLAAAGKAVLKEKPLGRNLDEARLFTAAISRHGGLLKTAIQRREHPSYERLAHELATFRSQGRVGENRILGLDASLYLGLPPGNTASGWRGEFQSAGGGVLLDAGYHLVDLAHFLLGSLDLLAASLWRAGAPARPEEIEDEAIVHARGGGAWVRLACGRGGVKHERVVVETTLGRFEADRERVTRDGVELLTCPKAWEQALVDQLDAFVAEANGPAGREPAVWDQLPAMAFIERAYGLARLNLPKGGA